MKNKNTPSIDLEKIIALMPGNVYWKNREGRYLGCNDNQVKALKLNSREDFIGKTLEELIGAEQARVVVKTDNDVMNKGVEEILEEIDPGVDGIPAIYLSKKTPLHDENGNVIGLLGVSLNITERKQLEEELRVIREREKDEEIFSLRKIIGLMPANVYWKDRAGYYKGCNEQQAKILKLPTTSSIVGKTLYDLLAKEYADELSPTDESVMANNSETTIEENSDDIKGNPAIYLTRKVPLHNNEGEVIGLVGISLDITERKKMEEELRLAKEKAENALRDKEIAEIQYREKSTQLTNVLAELNQERYYLSGAYSHIYLTRREAECLVCLARGNSIKETGKTLTLSPRTVEEYVKRIKTKLDCRTKAEVIAKAIEHRFLDSIRPVAQALAV